MPTTPDPGARKAYLAALEAELAKVPASIAAKRAKRQH